MVSRIPLHVVVTVVCNDQGEVLITRRPPHVHQGDRWEFPGGKVEADETVAAALRRELQEELGIEPLQARPLIRVPHDYADRSVLLDVWRVDRYSGSVHGREGQPLQWVAADDLRNHTFPAANLPIISAVRLPDAYLITPEPGPDQQTFLAALATALAGGIRLVQLRAKTLQPAAYLELAIEVVALCRRHHATLLLNAEPALVRQVGADGVHLSSERLLRLSQRPLDHDCWVAASCHDAQQLAQAAAIGVDFAVVGPVATTVSHPGVPALGWQGFAQLSERAAFPVYALGGMQVRDKTLAFAHGAQGIAAISGLWPVGI